MSGRDSPYKPPGTQLQLEFEAPLKGSGEECLRIFDYPAQIPGTSTYFGKDRASRFRFIFVILKPEAGCLAAHGLPEELVTRLNVAERTAITLVPGRLRGENSALFMLDCLTSLIEYDGLAHSGLSDRFPARIDFLTPD